MRSDLSHTPIAGFIAARVSGAALVPSRPLSTSVVKRTSGLGTVGQTGCSISRRAGGEIPAAGVGGGLLSIASRVIEVK